MTASNMRQPESLLVTGGAGFIGSNFVHRTLRLWPHARIVNLDALTYAGDLRNLDALPAPERHRFVHGDIRDAALVEGLLREHDVDTIVHFAAESHVDRSIAGPDAFIHSNVVGTGVLLEAARRVWLDPAHDPARHRLFHHISTDEVFGQLGPEDPPFNEDTPYAPNSPYSASKAASDHLVRAWHHTFGLPVTLSNCSNNYGPRQHAEKLIPTVVRKAAAGEPIPIYGDGSNVRDWLHVDDHCDAILAILQRAPVGSTWAIGGDCEVDNLTLAGLLCDLVDTHRPDTRPARQLLTFVSDRPGHDWRYAIDIARARKHLSWSPRVSLADGLRDTVATLLANADAHAPGEERP